MAKRARGYTLMEVTVSMTIIAILSAGVVATQNAAIIGGMQARRLDMASKIADTWLERLRADAINWNPDNPLLTTSTRGWLKNSPTVMFVASDTPTVTANWVLPATGAVPGQSPFFDATGRELVTGVDTMEPVFCVHMRIESVRYSPAGATLDFATALRAEVRVFYRKDLGKQAAACDLAIAGPVADSSMQFVYASTVLRENGL